MLLINNCCWSALIAYYGNNGMSTGIGLTYNISSLCYAVPDLPISSTGWSLGPQNLGGFRPRCIIYLTLLLDFLNNPSVIFLTQLHSISEYCKILNTPHHLLLYWNWLNTLPSSSVVKVGNWEGSHKWNSLGTLFI